MKMTNQKEYLIYGGNKMNLLSIDTTTKKASVSLKKDNTLSTKTVDNEITHSEKLLPIIDLALKENNLALENIDKYLILNGPGSFTGIRISLATLKAFSQVYKKDVFSISSLEALAYLGYKKTNSKYIVSFIDAKNDRVYFCIYKIETENQKVIITSLTDIQNEYLDDAKDFITAFIKENNIHAYSSIGNISDVDITTYPSTEDLIEIYENVDTKKHTFDYYSLNAVYARASQAERVKNGEN